MSNDTKNSVDTPLALQKFRAINEDFPNNKYVREWKKADKKVVGFICNFVPEELIHAAGMLPIRILGYQEPRSIKDGTTRLSTSICSFTRSCMQIMLDGELDFLDAFIGGNCCDGTRRFSESVLMEGFENLSIRMIDPPFSTNPESINFYQKQLENAKSWIEETFDVTITDEELEKSIELYNETRRLMREINELRKLDKPPIKGSEFLEVTNASFSMPKEELNILLAELLDELKGSKREIDGDFRLMISGTPMTDPTFFQMVESFGGLIVTEEMCTGSRYYWDNVEENTGDPVAALAYRYLTNYPCARTMPSNARFEKVQQVADEWRVDGMISSIIQFCALYGTDLLELKELCEKANRPLLELSIQYNEGATGQNRTRVQAFMEMLRSSQQ